MIVTSRRCFLNKFIQRYPAEIVLNANYYILDRNASGNNGAMIGDDIHRDEFGQLHNVNNSFLTGTAMPMGSIYHIRYNTLLDPTPYSPEKVYGQQSNDGFSCGEERYISYLNKDSTIIGTYRFLFADKLEGNGLQIAIMEDDKMILRFGHILCQYLSTMFGVDIVYLDPIFRPNSCVGYPQYNGVKENLSMVKRCREYDMVFNFNQAVSQSELRHTVNNITEHLADLNLIDLMTLYNLLYPDAPLPQGNYSEDQMRELLLYRATIGMDMTSTPDAFQNLLTDFDWTSITNRMMQEAEDFSYDDTGLF